MEDAINPALQIPMGAWPCPNMPEAQFEHVQIISVSHHTLKAASEGKKGSCAEKRDFHGGGYRMRWHDIPIIPE